MNTEQQRMAAVFNEWARRYAEDPDGFTNVLDAEGKPFEDYGLRCAVYYESVVREMDAKNLLPVAGHVPVQTPWPDPPTE